MPEDGRQRNVEAEAEEASPEAKQTARNAKKAMKRAAKRQERREEEKQQQEEKDEARRVYTDYVTAADVRYQQAQEDNDPCSSSNTLRTVGNKLYFNLDGIAPAVLDIHTIRAENMYKDALAAAVTPLERCFANKNLAALCKKSIALNKKMDGAAAVKLQVDALRYYVAALMYGSECQTITWMDAVYGSVVELVDGALRWEDSDLVRARPKLAQGWPELGEVLERLHSVLPLDCSSSVRSGHVALLKGWLGLALAKHLYAEAVTIQDGGATEQAWRRALGLVGRVQPLLEAAAMNARRGGDGATEEEAESLLESVDITGHICRSVQARHVADAMMRGVLADSETLDMEGMRVVTDKYREAIAHARGHDLESEARALVALGRMYCNVLRMKDRGLQHYRQVMELGVAMMPRVVNNTPWYQEARAAVLKAQEEASMADERAAAACRAPFVEELGAEFAAIRAAAGKGAHVLLRHVYEKHPPKGTEPMTVPPEALAGDKLKDTLRRAIIQYHPDKQVTKPRKWQVLAEEITKELNVKYSSFK